MRKSLRETSTGQETHQEYVEKCLQMLQHKRDERGGGMITDVERAAIESRVRIVEEDIIKDIASKNCRLKNRESELHPIAKETSRINNLLRMQESLYEEGKINETQIQKARKQAQLQREEYWLRQKIVDLLISANNYG